MIEITIFNVLNIELAKENLKFHDLKGSEYQDDEISGIPVGDQMLSEAIKAGKAA